MTCLRIYLCIRSIHMFLLLLNRMFLRLPVYFYFFYYGVPSRIAPETQWRNVHFVIRWSIGHTLVLQAGPIVIITITIWAYIVVEQTWFFAFFRTNTLFLLVYCCALILFVSLPVFFSRGTKTHCFISDVRRYIWHLHAKRHSVWRKYDYSPTSINLRLTKEIT